MESSPHISIDKYVNTFIAIIWVNANHCTECYTLVIYNMYRILHTSFLHNYIECRDAVIVTNNMLWHDYDNEICSLFNILWYISILVFWKLDHMAT